MKNRRVIGLLGLVLSSLSSAEVLKPSTEDRWYVRVLQETISPVTTDAQLLFASGSIVTAGFFAHKKRTGYDFFQSEYGEDKPQGTFSQIGDYSGQLIPNALYTVGMLSFGWLAEDEKALKRASFMIRATAYPAIMSSILKFSFEEKRPSGGKYSFPSGHTTTAFAFATAVACEHPWYWGVPAFALATFVGLSRMNDEKHYFHDVLAGATLGSSYALGIYLLDSQRLDTDMSVYPVYNTFLAGVGIAQKW